jgi:hypothetical protein
MVDPLSVDDFFTVGVSFDLLGGYLLGRGLLSTPQSIARRNTNPFQASFNAAEAVSQVRSRADAQVGLVSLATGFVLQAGGYVAFIGGVPVRTGGGRAALAVVAAFVAAVVAWLVLQRIQQRLVIRHAIGVARANPMTGRMDDYPDAETLIALGHQLGFPRFVEVSPSGVMGDESAYAREHFGVERVSRRYPAHFPVPPASRAPDSG